MHMPGYEARREGPRMGEAKRRASNATPRDYWELGRVTPELFAHMIATGHPELDYFLKLIGGTIRRMGDESQPTPLCLTCDHEFARGEAPAEFIVFRPFAKRHFMVRRSPTSERSATAIVNMLCARCAADPSIDERIAASYRKNLFDGDLTVLEP